MNDIIHLFRFCFIGMLARELRIHHPLRRSDSLARKIDRVPKDIGRERDRYKGDGERGVESVTQRHGEMMERKKKERGRERERKRKESNDAEKEKRMREREKGKRTEKETENEIDRKKRERWRRRV